MKTFLALLISCLTLSAATTYPVLTDSTNRLFPGGVTNVFFLNSNVVTTGTMRATGAVTLTNASNVFAGDGSGLTGITGTNSPTLNGTNTWTGLNKFDNEITVGSMGGAYSPDYSGSIFASGDVVVQNPGSRGLKWAYPNQAPRAMVLQSAPDLQLWTLDAGGSIQFHSRNEGEMFRVYYDATHTLALRNGTNAQTLRIYGTRDGTNHVRAAIAASSTAISLTAETDGTGADNVPINLIPAGASGVVIGSGGAGITKILSATATLNFDLTALTVEDLTITVTGAADGDVVTLGVPNGSVTTSVQYSAWVSAADTVTVRARTSATGENPASGTFRATVIKH